jgi:hypothetical protein
MSGLVFDGLTPEQKALAVKILNENSCDCGCGMRVAVCRRDDPKCPRSPGLGSSVIDLVKQGKGSDEIVKAVLTPPTKFVSFALTPGDAPSIGPKNAKVTLLHYSTTSARSARAPPPSSRSPRIILTRAHRVQDAPAEHAPQRARRGGRDCRRGPGVSSRCTGSCSRTSSSSRATIPEPGERDRLDVDRFTKDIDAHTYSRRSERLERGGRHGATGTPASFINGRYLSGAKPYGTFRRDRRGAR